MTGEAKSAEGKATGSKSKSPAQDKLDALGLDAIVAWLDEGLTVPAVAERAEVSVGVLYAWQAKSPERLARMSEALQRGADAADAQAEKMLKSEDIEPWRARELAQHYRWRASKRAPQRYGDRIDVTASVTVSADEAAGRLSQVLGVALPPLPGAREGDDR
jgi:transposase